MINFNENNNMFSLFKTISNDLFHEYLNKNLFRIVEYKKGQVIHFDNDVCKRLELILEGKVVIERIDESGDLFTITELYPDDIIGGSLIFSNNPISDDSFCKNECINIRNAKRCHH